MTSGCKLFLINYDKIFQDHRYSKYMKKLHVYLHHKNIDVSTVKELYRRWRPNQEIPVGNKNHLALGDIMEAIDELKYFVKVGFINP